MDIKKKTPSYKSCLKKITEPKNLKTIHKKSLIKRNNRLGYFGGSSTKSVNLGHGS